MKKLGAYLAIMSLLSVAPVAFAQDGNAPAPTPSTPRLEGPEASMNSHPEASTSRQVEDKVWHAGDLREAGLYMGPDGMLHFVPTQNPRVKLY
jgi:hypothetical protein